MPHAVDIGGWIPSSPQELEQTPLPRAIGRGRPDTPEDIAHEKNRHRHTLIRSTHRLLSLGRPEEAAPLVKTLIDTAHLAGAEQDLMKTAITATPFVAQSVEMLESFGLDSCLTQATPAAVSVWASASGDAWEYAFARTQGTTTHEALQKSLSDALLTGFGLSSFTPTTPLMVLHQHAKTAFRRQLRTGPDTKYDHLARHLAAAIASRNLESLKILLDPHEFGTPETVSAYLRVGHISALSSSDLRWLSQELAKDPLMEKTWSSGQPVSKSFHKYTGTASHNATKRFLNTSFHRNGSVETITTNMVGVLILDGDANVFAEMIKTPSGRQAIVSCVTACPYLLRFVLSEKNRFGIDETHLLEWGGDAIRAWRDPNGCCLAHYAASVQGGPTACDKVLTRMINLVPEWRHVVRPDGVSLVSLFSTPEGAARASRKEMKEVTRDINREKPSMSSLPKRRM